jgi:hypothetical protein
LIDRILTLAMASAAALLAVACVPDDGADAAVSIRAGSVAQAEAPVEVAQGVQPATELSPEDACRRAVLAQFGQEGPAVTFVGGVVSWRAPVDGGRLSFDCVVNGRDVSLARDGETQVVTLNTAADNSAQQEAH